MINIYKLGSKVLAISLTCSLLLSCDKEETQPVTDTAQLTGKQWQLNKVTVMEKGQVGIDNIPACQQDDAIEFRADKVFIRYNGQNKCPLEADSEVSQWSIFQDPRVLIFDSIEYQIINLDQVGMSLQRELSGPDGEVTIKYYYIPK